MVIFSFFFSSEESTVWNIDLKTGKGSTAETQLADIPQTGQPEVCSGIMSSDLTNDWVAWEQPTGAWPRV